MKILKSIFSQVHIGFAIFAGINILFGLALKLSVPFFQVTALLHFITGILVFLVPILIVMLMKDRKLAWKAFKARLMIKQKDFDNKLLLTAKITAWLFLISLFFVALGGITIKSGLAAAILPNINLRLFHTKAVYLLPPLLVLHILSMLMAYAKKNNNMSM